MGHVQYINIVTWFRGFHDKLLYLVLFSLHQSLSWELIEKETLKITIFTQKPRSHVRVLILGLFSQNLP